MLMSMEERGMKSIRPNNFILKGQDINITYDTGSFSARPLLNGQYKGKTMNIMGGNIRREETEIGQLVTVDLQYEADRATVTLTLLIPRINLEDNNSLSQFETEVIITEQLTSLGGPDLVNGVIQIYRFESIEGEGRIRIA
jgi:hypothetical protein